MADIAKFFDQLRRPLVYKLAEVAGMPTVVLTGYKVFVDNLLVYNSLAGGLGTPYARRCGIPQGCPFSMMMVALIMKPWIILMRQVTGIMAFILADDVLVMVDGTDIVGNVAEAIDKTHEYLHDMGANVAPDKSYNFASTKVAMEWLRNTWWAGIRSNIEVVNDFRYLGAHLNAKDTCASKTLVNRLTKAGEQLKKAVICTSGRGHEDQNHSHEGVCSSPIRHRSCTGDTG